MSSSDAKKLVKCDCFDKGTTSEKEIEQWLNEGSIDQLEKLVLDGRGDRLMNRTSTNKASLDFIQGITMFQAKIDAIHKAVEEGDVRRVHTLIDRVHLATARDKYGLAPLHKALIFGQTNTVRYLVAKYPQSVNAVDHDGRTALHYAASLKHGKHIVKMLQKAGADAFIEDDYGHTPFYYRTHGRRLNIRALKDNAVINQLISGQLNRSLLQDLEEDLSDWIHTGNVGKLEELVLNGYADLLLGRTNEVDDTDTIDFLEILPQYQAKIQAVHKAIEKGDLKCVKLLIDRKKMAFCRDNRHLTPLHKAIIFSRIDIAKCILLNYPQAVNAIDAHKRTPLHYAAALRDGGYLYKILRKAGADPNIYDSDGRSAKFYLKYPGEIDFLSLKLGTKAALEQTLQNRIAPSYLESGIQQWVREGNIGKLNQLVLSGCGDLLLNRSTTNSDSASFLEHLQKLLDEIEAVHNAVKSGNLEKLIQTMVSKKLALARNRRGCTPLHVAIVYEQTEIVRHIAANYPSVLNAPDYNKRTPMHYAAASRDGGHYMKILGKAGADPALFDNEGRTPEYYRKNAIFDLKSMRGDDADSNDIGYEFLDQSPRNESIQISDSASLSGSSDGSAYQGGSGSSHNYRLDRYIQEKIDFPTSDNGIYLAQTVAPTLTKALAEVLMKRPADPIAFISDWLSTQDNLKPEEK